MQTTLHQTLAASHTFRATRPSAIARFFRWSARQESSRFGWVAGILALHGCVITPITILFVAATGMNLALFITTMSAMGLALTTNLAAMPTKVTIPAFVLSVIIDVAVVVACFAIS
jgi:hypothetical protein